jgi:sec-independent protein translocase protein TatB
VDLFGVNGWEFILLIVIAVFVLGPDRLPEYAAKLARGIRKARVLAEGAKEQLKDQLGPDYEDINWRQYDPRQYDPRRIVREALLEPLDEAVAPVRGEIDSVRAAATMNGGSAKGAAGASAAGAAAAVGAGAAATASANGSPVTATSIPDPARPRSVREFDPERATPFDADAT